MDLSAQVLPLARESAATAGVTLSSYLHVNALDLSALPSYSFDAVLLLGPLYHLLSLTDREGALNESRRLLREGGLIFAAFITHYSPFRDAARHDPMVVIREPELLRTVLTTNLARALLTPACSVRGRIAALGMSGDVPPSEHPTATRVLDAACTASLYRCVGH